MPSTPGWNTGNGATNPIGINGGSIGTNDSWPVFAGTADPGSTVHFDIDGTEFSVPTDENGAWDFVPPTALSNGDHEFEMWSEEGGEKSDVLEWDNNIDADSVARQNDYSRVKKWKEEGSDQHRERFRPTTGGGGGSQTETAMPGGGTTTTPVGGGSGFEKGSGTAVAVGTQPESSAQNLEKGNKQEPCDVCGEPRGDASPCPICGSD